MHNCWKKCRASGTSRACDTNFGWKSSLDKAADSTCWGVWKLYFVHSTCCAVTWQSPKSQPSRASSDTISWSSPTYVSPVRGVLRVPKASRAHIISGWQTRWTPPRVFALAVMRKDPRRFAQTKRRTYCECPPQLKCPCATADMFSKTRFYNQSRDYHWTFCLIYQTFHGTNRCALGLRRICSFGEGFSLNLRKYKFCFPQIGLMNTIMRILLCVDSLQMCPRDPECPVNDARVWWDRPSRQTAFCVRQHHSSKWSFHYYSFLHRFSNNMALKLNQVTSANLTLQVWKSKTVSFHCNIHSNVYQTCCGKLRTLITSRFILFIYFFFKCISFIC